MRNYYTFLYLDDYIIDSLYPQIFDDITEKEIIYTNNGEIDSSIDANLFGLLSSNLKSTDYSSATKSTKSVMAIPRKAQLLINYFRKDTIDLQNIIDYNQPLNDGVFIVSKAVFFLNDIYNKNTGKSLFNNMNDHFINQKCLCLDDNSVFILESGNTAFICQKCLNFIEDENYYKLIANRNMKYGIMMHMSNIKMKKSIRHLTTCISKTKPFKLYVFGELIQTSKQFYKIIPFAIWQ